MSESAQVLLAIFGGLGIMMFLANSKLDLDIRYKSKQLDKEEAEKKRKEGTK